MFNTLVIKELKSVFFSPKFGATFAVSTCILLLSVYVGIRDYQFSQRQYAAAQELVKQEMREARQWGLVSNRVFREPNPLQIFTAGVEYDIGRYSSIDNWQPVKLVHSAYSDDPIYALFRSLDFTFIVEVVLTLLAILFTYDAVNGERESGTLQLVFSNAVSRAKYVLAKFVGALIGLSVPLIIPTLLCVLLLLLSGVPMRGQDWERLGLLVVASFLVFTFFVAFGLLMSVLTKRPSVSFLLSLVAWVGAVLIIPRAGVMAAGQLVKVPTVAELESLSDAYARDRWNQFGKDMRDVFRKRESDMEGMSDARRKAKRDQMEWTWAEEDDAKRKNVQEDIDKNVARLREENRNVKMEQEKMAFLLSKVSPVSAFQLAAMELAGTDVDLKARYEDGLNTYRTGFNEYKRKKVLENGGGGGLRITVDSKEGVKIDTGREIALDLTDLPEYRSTARPLEEVVAGVLPDMTLLAILSLLAFGGAFLAFLRYDVR